MSDSERIQELEARAKTRRKEGLRLFRRAQHDLNIAMNLLNAADDDWDTAKKLKGTKRLDWRMQSEQKDVPV